MFLSQKSLLVYGAGQFVVFSEYFAYFTTSLFLSNIQERSITAFPAHKVPSSLTTCLQRLLTQSFAESSAAIRLS